MAMLSAVLAKVMVALSQMLRVSLHLHTSGLVVTQIKVLPECLRDYTLSPSLMAMDVKRMVRAHLLIPDHFQSHFLFHSPIVLINTMEILQSIKPEG